MNELNFVIDNIKSELTKVLDNAGIYYRIFARQKSTMSIQKKLNEKGDKYRRDRKKMQDIIGIRIVFYFMDDVDIVNNYLHNQDNYLDESDSAKDIQKASKGTPKIGNLTDKIFMPTRLNLVFRMDEKNSKELKRELANVKQEEFDSSLVDDTFEVQLRTVLSEGWHEVEHDLRYKTKDELWWEDCEEESRMLNGLYATLETSERAMLQIFSSIAYKNYKGRDWSAMLRNHFRIHTKDLYLSDEVAKLLSANQDVAKKLFKIERGNLINMLLNIRMPYPLKLDNIVFLLNRMLEEPFDKLRHKENRITREILDKMFE